MIVKIFDYGWGPEWPTKQFEQQLLEQYLEPVIYDDSRTVLINSVWYGQSEHEKTCQNLHSFDFNLIILVAMLDPAIPRASWFSQFNCPVLEVGYYQGPHELDYWALVVDQHFQKSTVVDDSVDIPFMCLNRKPHWHRRQLYQHLTQRDLVRHGLVSMGGDNKNPVQQLLMQDCGGTDLAPNSDSSDHGIVNDIMSLGHPDNWNRHFLNIVTETSWNIDQKRFVSEKIFKPMLGLRPFLVYDVNGAREWLSQRGFQDYTGDFQDITDLDPGNPDQLPDFVSILCQQPKAWFGHKLVALQEKIIYNCRQFEIYIAQQKNIIQQGIKCQI